MKLLSGNEAIAQGAWEAGCHIALDRNNGGICTVT